MCSVQMVLTTRFSQGSVLGTAPFVETGDRAYVPRTGEQVGSLQLPGYRSPVSHFLSVTSDNSYTNPAYPSANHSLLG